MRKVLAAVFNPKIGSHGNATPTTALARRVPARNRRTPAMALTRRASGGASAPKLMAEAGSAVPAGQLGRPPQKRSHHHGEDDQLDGPAVGIVGEGDGLEHADADAGYKGGGQ